MRGTCALCGKWSDLETHHIFNGPFRKKSEKYGYTIKVCHYCHNEPPYGLHFNAERDNALKRAFQLRAMEENEWDVERFIKEFGRSYLNE